MNYPAACLALLFAAMAHPARAATATGSLNLSITVAASCSVVSAPAINFGTVSVIVINIDQTTTLTVNCSATTTYDIGLSTGGGSGATYAARKMSNGGNAVIYSLYRDALRTQVWGETAGVDTLADTGTGADQSFTVYARVPLQIVPPPGTYTDTVTITITY